MEKFNEIIASDVPVLVDFYATWCGPCKMMHPVLEDLAKQIEGKARIIKIDIDKNQQLAAVYKVQSVPTFMLFKSGELKWRSSGAQPLSALKAEIEKVI